MMSIRQYFTILLCISCQVTLAQDLANPKEFINYTHQNFFEWLNYHLYGPEQSCGGERPPLLNEDAWRANLNMNIVKREQWGAIDLVRDEESFGCINYLNNLDAFSKLRNKHPSLLTLKDIYEGGRIVIHHTVVRDITVNELDEAAVNAKKLVTIDYHFYITKEGTIYEGRPLFLAGANAGAVPIPRTCRGENRVRNFNYDYDFRSIGISLEGNYLTENERIEYQNDGAQRAVKYLRKKVLSNSAIQLAKKYNIETLNSKYTEAGIQKIINLTISREVSPMLFLSGLRDADVYFQDRDRTSIISPQYLALRQLIKNLAKNYGVTNITGHRHVRSEHTFCPGQALLDDLKFDFAADPKLKLDFYDHPDLNPLLPPYKCDYVSQRCKGTWCEDNPKNCTRVQSD